MFKITSLAMCLRVLAGCGNTATSLPQPPARSAAADAEFRQLMLDVATSGKSCESLRERFIGLPMEGSPGGIAAGATPIAGRWWVRDCSVTREADGLRLRLTGPAWYRVDRDVGGFSVHQDIYFNVDAQMMGGLEIGYDPSLRLASIWFTPIKESEVEIEPLAPINARPETVGAFLVDVFSLGLLPRAVARSRVVSEGEQQFRSRLNGGVTLTLDLQQDYQIDMLLGQLARGQAPLRPYTDRIPWLINERQALAFAAVQVAGPFPAQNTTLDAHVERGAGADYACVCQHDLTMSFNGLAIGAPPRVPPSAIFARGQMPFGVPVSAAVSAPCPWYLVTTTRAPEAIVKIRIRKKRASAGSSHSAAVRLTLLSFEIEPHQPDGAAWDGGGGAPDPEIEIQYTTLRRVLVPEMKDTLEARPAILLPGLFEITPGMPIEITAVDVDVLSDDPIGKAVLRIEDLQRGPELVLPLRLDGATTGSLRLRVEAVK
jgi:hypothetical protein